MVKESGVITPFTRIDIDTLAVRYYITTLTLTFGLSDIWTDHGTLRDLYSCLETRSFVTLWHWYANFDHPLMIVCRPAITAVLDVTVISRTLNTINLVPAFF